MMLTGFILPTTGAVVTDGTLIIVLGVLVAGVYMYKNRNSVKDEVTNTVKDQIITEETEENIVVNDNINRVLSKEQVFNDDNIVKNSNEVVEEVQNVEKVREYN